MASKQDIRIRLGSINSTQQITASMRLIATRKVQKVKQRMERNRPYVTEAINIIGKLANNPHLARSEYIVGRPSSQPLIILITGDRGLCGGYNVNVEKEAYALMKKQAGSQMITVGAKGRDYFRRRKKTPIAVFKGLSENPQYEDAQNISHTVLDLYNTKQCGSIFLVYTEYHTMLLQTPKIRHLLPIAHGGEPAKPTAFMHCEPNEERLFSHAVSVYVSAVIYGAMLEAAVCEQCARIIGMDAAVKNADKIVDALTLQYNQMRQGAITQEIAEIVGGANAVSQ